MSVTCTIGINIRIVVYSVFTLEILSLWKVMFGQCRCDLSAPFKKQSDRGLHCLPFRLHFLDMSQNINVIIFKNGNFI